MSKKQTTNSKPKYYPKPFVDEVVQRYYTRYGDDNATKAENIKRLFDLNRYDYSTDIVRNIVYAAYVANGGHRPFGYITKDDGL